MIELEDFIIKIRNRVDKRREMRGLPKLTRPQIKKAYKMLQIDPKFARMSEDKVLSYFTGWFICM